MSELTHFNNQGRAKMVDVSEKNVTKRTAVARGTIIMKPETLQLIRQGKIGKGDVLAVAQIAGIMAAKKTSELIPMCHPIPLTGVDISFEESGENTIIVESTVKTTNVTGVEMEALTAVSVAMLTIYDMCKAVDKGMVLGETYLVSKTGGKSGEYVRNKGEISS
ncbi:cyclic pyranopterin monophosphate synthase MoaC [Tepidibacillus infernus]|uniref:cyclic pyranopterin monophosphate synthase MoaC n=1 Tax=Tepidibacillus TaxID=1494427 RepID=UPI000853E28C|nr:cyclic pyranopterin monophosphate synthase MoaC [Tepidibacillus sp. HK-1]GBF11119.1 cyclic pyranopterin monophosphate synthase accessory protein [Tepidibacillus sp. HK-1]